MNYTAEDVVEKLRREGQTVSRGDLDTLWVSPGPAPEWFKRWIGIEWPRGRYSNRIKMLRHLDEAL